MYIKKIVPKNTLQSSSERKTMHKMPAVAVKTSQSNANKDLQKLSHLVPTYVIGQS